MLIALALVVGLGGLVTISFVELSPRYTSFVVAGGAAVVCIYIWLQARNRERLANFKVQDLKDTSSYLQSSFTVAALILGAGWVVYTWNTQWDDQRAALQINISAEQKHPSGTTDNNGFFIGGNIIFRNAGTRRTTVRLADGPLFIAKVSAPPNPESESLWIPSGTLIEHKKLKRFKELLQRKKLNKLQGSDEQELQKLLDSGEIRKACNAGKIGFESEVYRFWLSRPSVDGRPNIELQDEIRPGEADEFNFLVRVKETGTYAVIFSSELTEDEEKGALPIEASVCSENVANQQPRWESAAYFIDIKKSGDSTPLCCAFPTSKNAHQEPRTH